MVVTAAFDPRGLRWACPLPGVLAGYGVELRRRGRWLVGRCPFHEDHTPSLLVDESDQHFHCFACAAHGDVLDLVMCVEGLDYRRAREHLTGHAPRANRPPSPSPRAPLPWGAAERACLAAALRLYRAQLGAEPAALAYAAGRGIARATLERCGVGFAAGGTLDADAAGRNAAAALQTALGEWALQIALPGVKDVADLAGRADGHARFARACAAAHPAA